MSYVVNDDIPKSCSKCPQRTLYHGINVCLAANKMKVSTSNKCRHEKCPLVELPKNHGRLIDADKLLKAIDNMRKHKCKTCSSIIDTKHCNRSGCWMIFISDFINSLPAIIEAEVSE